MATSFYVVLCIRDEMGYPASCTYICFTFSMHITVHPFSLFTLSVYNPFPSLSLQCRYKMEAMRGLGVDRHLFGLYCVAKGTNTDPLPDLFTDKVNRKKFLSELPAWLLHVRN